MATDYRDSDYLKAVAKSVEDFEYNEDLSPEINALAMAAEVDDNLLKAKLIAGKEQIPPTFSMMSGKDAEQLMSEAQKRKVEAHPDYESNSNLAQNVSAEKSEGITLTPYTDKRDAESELLDRGYEKLVDLNYGENIHRNTAVFVHPDEAVVAQVKSSKVRDEWNTQHSRFYASVEQNIDHFDGDMHYDLMSREGDGGILQTGLRDHRIEKVRDKSTISERDGNLLEVMENITRDNRYSDKGLEKAAEVLSPN